MWYAIIWLCSPVDLHVEQQTKDLIQWFYFWTLPMFGVHHFPFLRASLSKDGKLRVISCAQNYHGKGLDMWVPVSLCQTMWHMLPVPIPVSVTLKG